MVARKDEVTTGTLARVLSVHPRTVRNWAIKRIAGEPSPIERVRVGVNRHYYYPRAELTRLKSLEQTY